jgi:hypothetical protein
MTSEDRSGSITREGGTRIVAIRTVVRLMAAATLSIFPIHVVTQTVSVTTVDDPEAYAVYASLFAQGATVPMRYGSSLVIQQETVTNWGCLPSGRQFEAEWRSVVDNLKRENNGVRTLRPNQSLGLPYTLVGSADLRRIIRPPDYSWAEFRRKYPESGGYVQLSAVGFNDAKTRAIVYAAQSCGPECARGSHHVLEKADGSWRDAHVPGLIQCETGS